MAQGVHPGPEVPQLLIQQQLTEKKNKELRTCKAKSASTVYGVPYWEQNRIE